MSKVLIAASQTSWDQIVSQYDIEVEEHPKTFPILAILNIDSDENSMDIPGAALITVDMAAKFLSICKPERLEALPTATLMALQAAIPVTKAPVQVQNALPKESYPVVGLDTSGKKVSFTHLPLSTIHVGEIIQVNGVNYTIISMGIQTESSISGITEIKEESATVSMPGISDIPLDPGKFELTSTVSDAVDEAHVLDVERAI